MPLLCGADVEDCHAAPALRVSPLGPGPAPHGRLRACPQRAPLRPTRISPPGLSPLQQCRPGPVRAEWWSNGMMVKRDGGQTGWWSNGMVVKRNNGIMVKRDGPVVKLDSGQRDSGRTGLWSNAIVTERDGGQMGWTAPLAKLAQGESGVPANLVRTAWVQFLPPPAQSMLCAFHKAAYLPLSRFQ